MPEAARRLVADHDAGLPVGTVTLLLIHEVMIDREGWDPRGTEEAWHRATGATGAAREPERVQ